MTDTDFPSRAGLHLNVKVEEFAEDMSVLEELQPAEDAVDTVNTVDSSYSLVYQGISLEVEAFADCFRLG